MRTHFPYLAAIAALFTSSSALAQNDGILRLGDLQSPNEASQPAPAPVLVQQTRPVAQAQAPAVQPQGCSVKATADGSMTFNGSCSAEIATYNAAKRQRPAPTPAPVQQWAGKNCNIVPIDGGYRWLNASCSREDAAAQYQAQTGAGGVVRTSATGRSVPSDPYERAVSAQARMQRNAVVNGLIADLGHTLIGAAGSHLYRGGYGYSRGYYGYTGTGVYGNYGRASTPTCVGPYGSYAC